MILPALLFFVFAVPLVMAALKDATSMTIPNKVSLAMLGGFILMVPFTWQGFPELGEHLAVGLTFFAAGFAMFAFGWLGGGDAKLMAATAIWFTWPDAVHYIFYTTLFGAILAFGLIVGRKFIPVRVLTAPWAYAMFKDETKMPYGLALAAGALMTLPQSAIFASVM
jgi:prepilin peptidase CpaA